MDKASLSKGWLGYVGPTTLGCSYGMFEVMAVYVDGRVGFERGWYSSISPPLLTKFDF
jgi:hypothetical protein